MAHLNTEQLQRIWVTRNIQVGEEVEVVDNGQDMHWGDRPGHIGRKGFITMYREKEARGRVGVNWRKRDTTDYDTIYEYKSLQPLKLQNDKLQREHLSKVAKNLYTYKADETVNEVAKIALEDGVTEFTIVTKENIFIRGVKVINAALFKRRYRGIEFPADSIGNVSKGKLNDFTFNAIVKMVESREDIAAKLRKLEETLGEADKGVEVSEREVRIWAKEKEKLLEIEGLVEAEGPLLDLKAKATTLRRLWEMSGVRLATYKKSLIATKAGIKALNAADKGRDKIRQSIDRLMVSGLVKEALVSNNGVSFLMAPHFMRSNKKGHPHEFYIGEFILDLHDKKRCEAKDNCLGFSFYVLDYKQDQFRHPHATNYKQYLADGKLNCYWGCPGGYGQKMLDLLSAGDVASAILLGSRFMSGFTPGYEGEVYPTTRIGPLITNYLIKKTYNDVMEEYAAFKKEIKDEPMEEAEPV